MTATAKEAAEQRYLMRKEDRHNAFSYNDVTTFERVAFEAGATWKEAELQQRIKELEMQLEISTKDANAAWMYNKNANEKIKELEEKQGKFAEWASGEGWQWVDNYVGKHWVKGFDGDMQTRTTTELWAEYKNQQQ